MGVESVMMRMQWRKYLRNLQNGIVHVVRSPKLMVSSLVVALLVYVAIILSSNLQYTTYAFHNPGTLGTVVVDLSYTVYYAAGMEGIVLTILYAVFAGIATTLLVVQSLTRGFRNSLKLGGLAPGALIGGCASCGFGLVGVFGFVGGMSLLPFHGNLLRVVGIGIMMALIASVGHPKRCEI